MCILENDRTTETISSRDLLPDKLQIDAREVTGICQRGNPTTYMDGCD